MRKKTILIICMMLTVTFTGLFPIQTTVAADPILESPYPSINSNATYNPRFRISVRDPDNDPLTVIFKTNATGSWETLGTYFGGNGQYAQNTSQFNSKNTTYYWSVNVSDGTTWTNRTYNFKAEPFIRKWYYSGNASTYAGPLAADVDGDGIYEIFAVGKGKAYCVNGLTGALLWEYNNNEIINHSVFEIGDLNNDGIPEMVISGNETFRNNGKTIALHANNGQVYWIANQESGGKYVCIVDIEGNNLPVVYICSGDFQRGVNGNGRLRMLEGTTGRVLKETFLYRPCWGGISCADADNDGRLEVYVAERRANYSSTEVVNGTRIPFRGQLNLGMMCYDAETLQLLWYQDAVTASSHMIELIDVDNDGILDAVGLQQNGGGAYVVDGATWDKMPNFWQNSINDLEPHSPFPLYDIDNDGKIEMIVASNGPARMWKLGMWNTNVLIGTVNYSEPPKMVNVIGDETLEIVGTSTGGKVYDPYGNLIEIIPMCYGLDTFVVQDIDNDWQNELIVLAGNGYLQCFETSAYAPTTPVRSNVQLYSERRIGVGVYIPPPGAPQPIIKTVSPADGAYDVGLNPALCAKIIDYHHDRMNIVISINVNGSWVNKATYTNVGNGWYNITNITTMNKRATTYYWRVTAVDPYADNLTTTETYSFTTLAPPDITEITATPSAALPDESVNISCNVMDGTTVNTVRVNIKIPNESTPRNLTASGGDPVWTVLCYDDFESGWGNYKDGGSACTRYTGGPPYAYQGLRAAKIENFLGLDSSFYLDQPIDVHTPRYTSIKVDFWFIAHEMSNLSNFWVKFYDGQHWRIVDNYIKPGAAGYRPTDKPFENDEFYHAITWINESKYTFPTNMKIRFECDGDPREDPNTVYIDQIYINATTSHGSHYYFNDTYSQLGTYEYYIWARDSKGNSIRSPTQSFEISANTPSNPSPKNNSINIPRTADLSWTSGGSNPGETVTYDVYFGTTSPPPQIADDITNTSYDPGTLAYNTLYYWRIIARNSSNQTSEGPLWHFTTVKEQSGGGGGGGGGQEPPAEPNKKPIANASAAAPYEGFVNSAVLFDGSLSSDPDGDITEWYWTFGDGTNGTGKIISHTYTTIGIYNITLQVTDDKEATNSTKTICVISQPNRPPTEPLITGPTNGTVNTVISFSAVSTDEDNDTIQYTFIWEDIFSEITYANTSEFVPSGTPVSFSHRWTTPGQYRISVTAIDSQNASTTAETTITIEAEQPAKQPTPGFELALILSALVLSILLWRKKRKI